MIPGKDKIAFFDCDTQIDFLSPDGKLYIKGSAKIIKKLKLLTDFAKKNNIPLVASVDTHIKNDPEFRVFPPHCIKGTKGHEKIPETNFNRAILFENKISGRIVDGKRPVIIEKKVYDVFSNINTERILSDLGRRTFVLYGVVTEYCVKLAAIGIRKRKYDVFIVKDAVKEITKRGEKPAISLMRKNGVKFISSAEDLIKRVGV